MQSVFDGGDMDLGNILNLIWLFFLISAIIPGITRSMREAQRRECFTRSSAAWVARRLH